MFDVGFSEMVVIGLVALIVFGPQDLPRVARTVGHILGKFRRYVADVKGEINREMEAADLKRIQEEMQASMQSLQASVNEQARVLEQEFANVGQSVENALKPDSAEELPAAVTPAALEHGPVEESFNPAPILDTPAEPALADASLAAADLPAVPSAEGVIEHDPNQLDMFGEPIKAPITQKVAG